MGCKDFSAQMDWEATSLTFSLGKRTGYLLNEFWRWFTENGTNMKNIIF